MLGACANSQSETALAIGTAIHSHISGSILALSNNSSAVVYYTSLIMMYTRFGYPKKAVSMYSEMLKQQIQPGPVTYICLLTACGAVGPSSLAVGKQICHDIQHSGIITEVSLENSLLSMLVKCGEPLEAITRWKTLHTSNSFTSSTVTYICVLAACADIGPPSLIDGTYVHSLLSESEAKQQDVTAALVNMYARCGQPLKSLELWRSFTASYGGIPTSPALYTAIFTACAMLSTAGALHMGSEVRNMMGRSIMQPNSVTNTAMMQMYSRCGDAGTAIAIWKEMISQQMQPTQVTYPL